MQGVTVDIIDVLFVVMATFGFYFGFTFGLLKLALVLFSFLFATLAAMAFTPMTTNIIMETFAVDSVFLPFIAFFVTLLIVLMLARIVTKLLEETLTSRRFDILSRVVGGFLMVIWFSLLYSVLVIFFGRAGVLKLVFNERVTINSSHGVIRLGIPPKALPVGAPDTLYMEHSSNQKRYNFGNDSTKQSNLDISLGLGLLSTGKERFKGYISKVKKNWSILPADTILIGGTSQLIVQEDKNVICFCDSSFQIYLENNQLIVDCLDRTLSAKSPSSKFYPYIEQIPKRGTQLISGFRPFIDRFSEYMGVAVERLQNDKPPPEQIINTNTGENNKPIIEPVVEQEDSELKFQKLDTLSTSIDTSQTPMVSPSKKDVHLPKLEKNKEDSVKYEG